MSEREPTTGQADAPAADPSRSIDVGPLRLRLQVIRDGEGAFGPGKAALLEAIAATGSISAAGRALDISYRRCWLMVDEMNRLWETPLVESRRGGREQGARLSVLGQEVLTAYRALEKRLINQALAAPEAAVLRGRLKSSQTG